MKSLDELKRLRDKPTSLLAPCFDIAAHLRLQFDSATMRPTQPVTVEVRELELACQEIEVLRELVYCYPPNPPFASEGETWKECAERLAKKVDEYRKSFLPAKESPREALLRKYNSAPI